MFMLPIQCSYINLNHATGRRKRFESSFMAHLQGRGFDLLRIPAIDKSAIQGPGMYATITDAEMACLQSHRYAILNAMQANNADKHHMICEDDCKFGEHTARLVYQTLEHMRHVDWDIIFTCVAIGNSRELASLVEVFEHLHPQRLTSFQRGQDFTFSGASCYLLNPKSASKFIALFKSTQHIDVPIDIFFRNLSHAGLLKTYFTFPFVTALDVADCPSYIQTDKLPIGQTLEAVANIYCINTPDEERQHLIARMENQIRSDALRAYGAACANFRQLSLNR
ncbi:MAG TPA: glycosyltransferase family 25 protein [Limnobacter sp.]|nr:glycosyltransferase family 25 protein [Limnobacter sp.]